MTLTRSPIPADRCPGCRARLDAATCATQPGAAPSVGDFTICFECGLCLRFARGLALAPATPAEVLTLPAETQRQIGRVTAAVLSARARRGLS